MLQEGAQSGWEGAGDGALPGRGGGLHEAHGPALAAVLPFLLLVTASPAATAGTGREGLILGLREVLQVWPPPRQATWWRELPGAEAESSREALDLSGSGGFSLTEREVRGLGGRSRPHGPSGP